MFNQHCMTHILKCAFSLTIKFEQICKYVCIVFRQGLILKHVEILLPSLYIYIYRHTALVQFRNCDHLGVGGGGLRFSSENSTTSKNSTGIQYKAIKNALG